MQLPSLAWVKALTHNNEFCARHQPPLSLGLYGMQARNYGSISRFIFTLFASNPLLEVFHFYLIAANFEANLWETLWWPWKGLITALAFSQNLISRLPRAYHSHSLTPYENEVSYGIAEAFPLASEVSELQDHLLQASTAVDPTTESEGWGGGCSLPRPRHIILSIMEYRWGVKYWIPRFIKGELFYIIYEDGNSSRFSVCERDLQVMRLL